MITPETQAEATALFNLRGKAIDLVRAFRKHEATAMMAVIAEAHPKQAAAIVLLACDGLSLYDAELLRKIVVQAAVK